jgi:hypothetical protein
VDDLGEIHQGESNKTQMIARIIDADDNVRVEWKHIADGPACGLFETVCSSKHHERHDNHEPIERDLN